MEEGVELGVRHDAGEAVELALRGDLRAPIWMTACMATRASVPPTLMRRTPSAARSSTVKPKAPLLRKFTGFGATAFTTAAISSRVLMPGA